MKKFILLTLIALAAACTQTETIAPSLTFNPGVNQPSNQYPLLDARKPDNGREQTCIGQGAYQWTWQRTHNNYPTTRPSDYNLSVWPTGNSLNGCLGVSGVNMAQPDAQVGYNSQVSFTLFNYNASGSNYAPFNYAIYRGRGYASPVTGTLQPGQSVNLKMKLPLNVEPGQPYSTQTIRYVMTPVCPYANQAINHRMTMAITNASSTQLWPIDNLGQVQDWTGAVLPYTPACP
jgi:hypothetical protein